MKLASDNTAKLFTKILARAKTLDHVNTRKWFEDLVIVKFEHGLIEIGCPDEATTQFMQDNCQANFSKAAQNVTGRLVSVIFTQINGNLSRQTKTDAGSSVKLHPDYTFENFVVGPCNRLAQASCIAVSHSPGDTYNPLFLYGSSGLGKTHLQHAICHGAKKNSPDIAIKFLSCEEFVNNFISAIEQGNLPQFQSQLRNVDILVIDDVQFLQEREHSQEEFFHTFNALYNNRKQIVLTADCPPKNLASLQDRLVSRFKWGLVARLDPPSYETRVAIVQKKANLRGLKISEEIAEYIAAKVKANIRELEGALTIMYATALASDSEITLELAKNALGDNDLLANKNITMAKIIEAVTAYYDVRTTDLQSKKRSQSITLPRQICMYLARNLTKHSLEEIGGHMGGRDHTTVLHACGKIQQLTESNPDTQMQIKQLTETIKGP